MPLAVLDRLRHVVHVGSFSHTIAPTVGCGFIAGNASRMQYIRFFRPTQGLGNALIQERVLYRFLHEGTYRRRCERARAHLTRRAVALGRTLRAAGFATPPLSGGLFLWGFLGEDVDAMAVARRMLARGYLTAPAKHFTANDANRSFMRFNVTTTNAPAVEALVASL